MAKSDIQTAASKWVTRITQARAAGIPDSSWKDLVTKDLQQVAQGHSPMNDKEVQDAMLASVGKSPIKDPSLGTSPLDILGNIPSDIHDIVTGFPGGIAGYVTSIPSAAEDLYTLATGTPAEQQKIAQQYNLQTGDIGDYLRSLGNVPLLGPLIPGAHTVGALTTPQGRQSLEQHPVSTVIDVGAAAALGGRAAGAAEKMAGVDEAAKSAAIVEQGGAPTVGEAITTGHPYKAVGRAALKAVEATPVVGEKVNRATLRQFFVDMGFDPEWSKKAVGLQSITNRGQRELQQFVGSDLAKKLRALPVQEQALVDRVLGGVADPADLEYLKAHPELKSTIDLTRRTREEILAKNPSLQGVPTKWGKTYYWHKNHPVAQSFIKAQQEQEKVAAAETAMHKAIDKANALTAKFGADDKRAYNAHQKATEATDAWNKATAKAHKAGAKHVNQLASHSPPAFFRNRSAHIRAQATEFINSQKEMSDEARQQALNQIASSTDFQEIRDAVGNKEADKLLQESESMWQQVAQQPGVDPIWLPNTDPNKMSWVTRPRVSGRYSPATALKDSTFNMSNSVHNVLAGLIEEKRKQIVEAATKEFVDSYVKPYARNVNDIKADVIRAIGNGQQGVIDAGSQAVDEVNRHWVVWNPGRFGLQDFFPASKAGDLYIPKGLARTLESLGEFDRKGPISAIYNPALKVWKFSVLSTPRHISHVVLGGGMMGVLQDPGFLLHLHKAYRIMKGDYEYINSVFAKDIHEMNIDHVQGTLAGKSIGRILAAIPNALDHFEENVTQMYKIAYMLRKEAKGTERDEAIHLANKVFVDANNVLPIERVIMRKVFPFYAFTRHLFRYLMTYPNDHPMVAGILTNFANQHYADWKSGLPRDLQFMFFLGAPDTNGNVPFVDYRSIDPFRSFYNDFTLAGISSQINPAVQMVAKAMGIDVLSGTQELYPNTHYNPDTGQMVADHPPDLPLQLLEEFVPETEAIDAKFALSDTYRNLKISDPQAYQQRIWSVLGMPFVPQQMNVPARVESAQMKRYRDAQALIDKAMQTGDFTDAKRYAAVPVPSLLSPFLPNIRYASPTVLERIYKGLQATRGVPGVSLHATLTKPRRTRTP